MINPTKHQSASRIFTAILACALWTGSQAMAADRQWNGGDGSWGTASNWDLGLPGTGDVAIFNVPANNNINQTLTLDGNRTVQGLTFNNAGTTLINQGTSGILTVNNSGNSLITTGADSGAVTIAPSVIFGTSGSGGAYTFNLNGGSLTFGSQVSTPRTGARTWEVNGHGTLNFAGGILLSHNTTTTGNTRNNTISGNGIVILGGEIDPGANNSTLATAVGFEGILRLVNTSNLMTGSNRITHNGGTIQFVDNISPALGANNDLRWTGGKIAAHGGHQTVSTNLNMATGGTMEISGSEALTLTGNLFTPDAGDMTLRVSNTALTTLAGDYLMNRSGSDINRNRTIIVDVGSTFRVDGRLTVDNPGAGIALSVQGGGILDLRNGNDYSNAGGSTTISSGGTLLANNTTGSATGTGAVTVQSGAGIGGSGIIGGNLTLQEGARFVFSPTDTLTVNGTFALHSSFGVASLLGFDTSVANNTYTLLNTTFVFNETNIQNFGEANAFAMADGRQAYFTNGSLQLVVIPEPGTLALLGIALGSLLLFRRR